MKKSIQQRLLKKIKKNIITDCWEWQGKLECDGYVSLWWEGKAWKAHRLSYYLFVDVIPEGLCVCHSCDNKKCINPDHLWVGTSADNTFDKVKKKRQAKGIDIGKLDYTSVLFIKDTIDILTCTEAARYIQAPWSTVKDIRCGRTWRHVKRKRVSYKEAA